MQNAEQDKENEERHEADHELKNETKLRSRRQVKDCSFTEQRPQLNVIPTKLVAS